MTVKNFIKVLDYDIQNNSAIHCRSWDRLNGFRNWNGSDKEIQSAKIMNVTIEKGNGFIFNIDIDINKLRDKGVL